MRNDGKIQDARVDIDFGQAMQMIRHLDDKMHERVIQTLLINGAKPSTVLVVHGSSPGTKPMVSLLSSHQDTQE